MTEQEAILSEALTLETQLSADLKNMLSRERARSKILESQVNQVAQQMQGAHEANQAMARALDEKNAEIAALKKELSEIQSHWDESDAHAPAPPVGGSEKTA